MHIVTKSFDEKKKKKKKRKVYYKMKDLIQRCLRA